MTLQEPENITLPGYYTTQEIQEIFSWRNYQQVQYVTKQEEWNPVKIGGTLLYPQGQVKAYYKARARTKLAKNLGWKRRGRIKLIRTSVYDVKCPECFEQAVLWGGAWECVNEHSGDEEYFIRHS